MASVVRGLLGAALLLLAGVLLAGWLNQPAAAATRLRLVSDNFPPFYGDTLPGYGLAGEIMTRALTAEGYMVELSMEPWARAVQGVQRGAKDGLICTWWSAERERDYAFTQPYARNKLRFLKRAGDPWVFRDLGDLTGRRVGVARGYAYRPDFDHAANFQREEAPDFHGNLIKLLAGRIDLTLEDEMVALNVIRNSQPEDETQLAFVDPPLQISELRLAVGRHRPDHDAIVAAFNRRLAMMIADGSLAALYQQHGFPADSDIPAAILGH